MGKRRGVGWVGEMQEHEACTGGSEEGGDVRGGELVDSFEIPVSISQRDCIYCFFPFQPGEGTDERDGVSTCI